VFVVHQHCLNLSSRLSLLKVVKGININDTFDLLATYPFAESYTAFQRSKVNFFLSTPLRLEIMKGGTLGSFDVL